MKASVRKIAELTGFSPATVSNALNRKRGVNQETSDRIFAVANEIGYEISDRISLPEDSGTIKKIRFVKYRKTGEILDDNQFHPIVIEGVEKQAKLMGLDTLFCLLDVSDADFNSQLTEIVSDSESGIILLGTEMEESDFALFASIYKKIIVLDGFSQKYPFSSVLINNYDSAEKAVEYLHKCGHKKIGYLRGNRRIQAFRDRENGFARALQRFGIEINPDYVATVGTRTDLAFNDMKDYLDNSTSLPTAFFADNDVIAIGAMRALWAKGYRIPDDVSVVGFDDISFGAIENPPLTTVRVQKEALGRIAVRELVSYSNSPVGVQVKIQIGTDFVERKSVKKIN